MFVLLQRFPEGLRLVVARIRFGKDDIMNAGSQAGMTDSASGISPLICEFLVSVISKGGTQ